MADGWAVAVAASAALGALHPASRIPLLAGALVALAALLIRRPVVLCLGVGLLAAALGNRALTGLEGAPVGVVEAEVVLLTDPEPHGTGVRADARLGRHHVELRASGPAEPLVARALAGEHLRIRGDVVALPPDDWTTSRHLAARVTVHRAAPAGAPDPLAALANGLRRTLTRGSRPLSDDERSLYAGLVIGDDRAQPAALTDDFRGAGLTHVLAVSGQNVAFLLALAGPVLRRMRLWPRLAVTLGLLLVFVVLTRAEPSVVRAGAMAALAATSTTAGRPLPRLRVLGLGVTALLLIDPLLVGSLGFRLSVAAAAAIVLAAPALAGALPGPRWLAEPLSVTVAAQLGVAPILAAAFGPVPLASVPANLLAVPAAGAVMAWGMSAGMVAGLVGGPAATLLHLPTRALLWWIEAVAARSAAAPLGALGLPGLAAVAAGLGLLVLARRQARGGVRLAGGLAVAAVVHLAVLAAHTPPGLRTTLRPGIVRWHAAGTEVVVLGGGGWRSPVTEAGALEALRTAGVGALDLLVVADEEVSASVVDGVLARHAAGALLVPATTADDDRPHGAVPVPAAGTSLVVGGLRVVLVPGEERLVVEAWPVPG